VPNWYVDPSAHFCPCIISYAHNVILLCQVITAVPVRKSYPCRCHLYSLLLMSLKIFKADDYIEKQFLSMILIIHGMRQPILNILKIMFSML
jgi:hypothetical protein